MVSRSLSYDNRVVEHQRVWLVLPFGSHCHGNLTTEKSSRFRSNGVTRGCLWLIYPSVPLVNFLSVLSHFLSLFPDNSCQYAPDTKLLFTPLLLCRASSDHWLSERIILGRKHIRQVNVLCFYLLHGQSTFSFYGLLRIECSEVWTLRCDPTLLWYQIPALPCRKRILRD